MSTTKLQGNTVNINGNLASVGSAIQGNNLVKTDLSEVSLADYKGSNLILNIFPSIDTGVCATSVRKFNEKAAALDNTKVLCISHDLPFALKRFCAAEGIENVESLSAFRSNFGEVNGLVMQDSALQGLLARSVIKVDTEGNITYTELVDDITHEPNYEAALEA